MPSQNSKTVCEGRSALCAVCRDPANPCSIDEPGRLNYAPILYRWEMEGHRSASQATGLTPSQVSAVLRMARDLSPACEQEISQVARDAATILGIVTTSWTPGGAVVQVDSRSRKDEAPPWLKIPSS